LRRAADQTLISTYLIRRNRWRLWVVGWILDPESLAVRVWFCISYWQIEEFKWTDLLVCFALLGWRDFASFSWVSGFLAPWLRLGRKLVELVDHVLLVRLSGLFLFVSGGPMVWSIFCRWMYLECFNLENMFFELRMMANWIGGIWVELDMTVFRTNQGELVIVLNEMFCTASSLLQFALDIRAPHAGPA